MTLQLTTAKPGRALIATHHLSDYAGSEIFTLELATELREMGWEVWVASFLSGEPMLSEFKKLGFRIVDILSADSVIRNAKFDLAWIHHTPVFYELFLANPIEAKKIIFCSLSHFEPLEAVPAYRENIHLVLANSIENKNFIAENLVLDEDQITVFPNAVPHNYWRFFKKEHSPALRKIVVISNHPPVEVLKAVTLFKRNGIDVTHLGRGGTQMLIKPSQLLNYDAVLTIGKTVPYCFALKLPVYCYDHFGGPGWLNADNFDLASQNNFSGRGFSRKSPETIVHEMLGGYSESVCRLDTYRNHAMNFHNLRKNLEQVLCRPITPSLKQFSITDEMQILKQHAQYMRLVRILSGTEAGLSASQKENLRIKSTFSWRLATPFRVAHNLIRHIFPISNK